MRRIIISILAFVSLNTFAQQQPSWNDCQYQQNPEQCMRGVPAWQQTPVNSNQPAKDPRSGLVQGNPNFQIGNGGTNCTTIKSGNQYQTNCK